jgi:DNA-binding response OmpR family regulator
MATKRDTPLILLVEHEELLADVTAFRLELLGYAVNVAGDSAKAHAALEADVPDLVIYDLALPDGKGIEFLNQIRSKETTAGIPVLIFSTDAELNNVQRVQRAGARDYLVTPFDPAVLEYKVEKLLSPEDDNQAPTGLLSRLMAIKF